MPQSQLYHVGLAALVAILVVAIGTRSRLGPDADWIEVARAVCLPILDPVIERAVGGVGSAYELDEREVAGVIDADPEQVERLLWANGCRRNVVSAYKTLDGRGQVGAWVYRGDAVGDRMQVDVMLFAGMGGTIVCAHREYSSDLRWALWDRAVLRKHYRGVDYDPVAGGRVVRETILPDADWV